MRRLETRRRGSQPRKKGLAQDRLARKSEVSYYTIFCPVIYVGTGLVPVRTLMRTATRAVPTLTANF